MDEKDISLILGSLPFPKEPKEAPVTPTALRLKAAHMAERGYIHSRKSLEALELYLKGYALLLSGPVGVGKTEFFRKVEPDGGVVRLPFNSCTLWDYDTLRSFLVDTKNRDIVIDDLGWERAVGDGISRSWGVKYDALQVILDYRLNLATRTHVTTNLSNDDLIKAYDYHLVDRIYELCKPVVWNTNEPSRRCAKPNALAVKEYTKEV